MTTQPNASYKENLKQKALDAVNGKDGMPEIVFPRFSELVNRVHQALCDVRFSEAKRYEKLVELAKKVVSYHLHYSVKKTVCNPCELKKAIASLGNTDV